MTKGNNRSRTMISMEPGLYARAKAEAKKLGMPFNSFVVLLLRQHFGEVSFISRPTHKE